MARRMPTYFHLVIVTIGIVSMTALTIRDASPFVLQVSGQALYVCLAIFSAEWLGKLAYAARGGGLLQYVRSVSGLVDALAVVPLVLTLLAAGSSSTIWLLASLWILKLPPASSGLSLLNRVIAIEARSLASVATLFFVMLFFASVMVHLAEREQQPQIFGSLPGALYWAVATLTTTGYGDAVPLTGLGRAIAGLVMIGGLAVFGLWTGILATGFAAESRRREFIQNWQLVGNVPFFKSLAPSAIIELARLLRRWDVPEKTVVIREGRIGDCMYFIASGAVEVQVKHGPVKLGPGAFFGEMALLGSGVRTATVVTVEPSTLLMLEVADFRAFTAANPDLAKLIESEADKRGVKHPHASGRTQAG